jgi:hypothetical protein
VNGRLLGRGLGALILTAGLVVAGSVAVSAAATPPAHPIALATLKGFCNGAVQRRLAVLGADDTFVQTSVALTSADRSKLEGQIGADEHGLTALNQTIQADGNYAQAYADCESIVTEYRVYVMEDPKVHEVIAADAVTAVDSMFGTVIPELQTLINVSTVSASVKAEAQSDLNALSGKMTASRKAIAGVTSSVINLVPSGWPGDATPETNAAASITTAGADLAGARLDVSDILTLLGE